MNPFFSPSHTSIQIGDVICFDRKNISAAVKAPDRPIDTLIDGPPHPETVDLVWIDGYSLTPSRGIPRHILERLADEGKLTLLMRGVENGWDAMRLADDAQVDSQNPDKRDTAVQIGPRVPVSDLSFERTYSRNRINGFLKHPLIDHKHGRVQKAKAMFVARRPDRRPAAVLTLNSPNARNAFDRETVEITRYASHPATSTHRRTNNTATWMLARACHWAALEGYSTVRTLAGTDGNTGTIYEAANFEYDGEANSSGAYNRDGRSNHTHSQTLKRYTRDVDVDGETAGNGLPHRVESRIENSDSQTGQTTSLTTFETHNPEPPTAEFRFTREEASDTKFTRGDNADTYPSFSDELHSLLTDTDSTINLDPYRDSRGRQTPAAVFGAAGNTKLIAAALVTGDPLDDTPTAHITEYSSRNREYPDNTAQWLLTRIRDWAQLNTYHSVIVRPGIFEDTHNANASLPQGVGFTQHNSRHKFHCD